MATNNKMPDSGGKFLNDTSNTKSTVTATTNDTARQAPTTPISTTTTSSVTNTLQNASTTVQSTATSMLYKIISPETLQALQQHTKTLLTTNPLVTTFIGSQISLGLFPITLFFLLLIVTGLFAIIAALLISLIGVLLFLVFAIFVALFVLLPTLFVTTFFATGLWVFGLVTFWIIRRFNDKNIPGVHVPLKDGLMDLLRLDVVSAEQDEKNNNNNNKQNKRMEVGASGKE